MAKSRTFYICQNCGRQSAAKMGRCPKCGEFNTMVEQVEEANRPSNARTARPSGVPHSAPQRLDDIGADTQERLRVPMGEFSRVLGGGLVVGSISLLGGEPGAGKSTLLLQMSAQMAQQHGTVLYVSGEESVHQIKMRADRLGLRASNLYLVTESNLGVMMEHVQRLSPLILIVDSIQTTYTDDLDSSPGLVSQVRECAMRLQGLAKSSGISVFLIGHVTKDGSIAGPRVLEHIVDTVLFLEGDPYQAFRLLRAVKNRFGATSEVGVFEMQGAGMVEVPNPSEAFLAERVINASGSAIAVTLEGTRPLLVEIQALTSPTTFGNARRTPNGVDMNRLLLIAAVLSKRLGYRLFEHDLFVNVVGGIKVSEPASDLAMAVAIASSYHDLPIPADMAFVGEVGLSGEVRAVAQLALRLHEAAKIGFKRVLVPKLRRKLDDAPRGLALIECRNIAEALRAALPQTSS
ncbi:MAG: DNA repair protein RadA [Anaerolineae bacterium]|nr:DNA repair protein RadA [Anaerolineae bacterium]MDW8173849.1 DNA repair protein RadA [Anaerolineae bacterium]